MIRNAIRKRICNVFTSQAVIEATMATHEITMATEPLQILLIDLGEISCVAMVASIETTWCTDFPLPSADLHCQFRFQELE